MSYYMFQIGLMTVKINKYFSMQSVISKLPKVLKDLLLTSANFVQLQPLRFSFMFLLKLYLKCNVSSVYF